MNAVPPAVDPNVTLRERFKQHETDAFCASCHRLMDPIGFGFEKYDGAGLFRTTENGKPIDDSGEVQDSDITGPFVGAAELGEKLSQSLFVQKCLQFTPRDLLHQLLSQRPNQMMFLHGAHLGMPSRRTP